MIDIILLIILLTITILYGYYQFSKNITDILESSQYGSFNEGFIPAPTMPTIESSIPFITNTNFSIVTEGKLIDFIIGMYTIISTGVQNSQDIPANIIDPTQTNVKSMILISNYSHILKGINQKTFNDLSTSYPNIIQTSYDIEALNELYYSSSVLNQYISKLEPTINLTDPSNAVIYNSLLGYFNAYYNSITYFLNIHVNPQIRLNIGSEDDYNTTTYYLNNNNNNNNNNVVADNTDTVNQTIDTSKTTGPVIDISGTNVFTYGPTKGHTTGPTIGPTIGPATGSAYNASSSSIRRAAILPI